MESGESDGVSVLAEGSGEIAAQAIVATAAHQGEYTRIATNAGLIFLECDVAGVVQRVLDVPMASDCDAYLADPAKPAK